MFLSSITDRGAMPALEKTLAYNEARLEMIAENVANIATPGYRAKQLDTHAFQRSLREAFDARRRDPNTPFKVEAGDEVHTERSGHLQVTPSRRPVQNILFHDGTNLAIERQMADLAETGMMHQTATTLLRGSFDRLRAAIRGAVG